MLFYGQSITRQDWWREVAADLRTRFPGTDLRIENRSIGGYSTQFPIRSMEADILPFHPDLIIFHDYGAEDLHERIIRWIRSNTTAEVLLQSGHVVWLPGLARKYGPGLVNIRGGWREHLQSRQLSPRDLLRDSVHLNREGEALYAAITKRYLVGPAQRMPTNSAKELQPRFRGGKLDLDFDGSRVELVDLKGATVDVWIDGKRAAGHPELYYHARSTSTWDADWPTVMRVGHVAPLQTEEWVLKVIERNEAGTEFQFELYGSITGLDGTGSSIEKFVSRSGRVVLEPADYDVLRSYGLHKIAMPGGWQIRRSGLPRFTDPVLPGSSAQTIVYGLKNGPHHLTLPAPKGSQPSVEKIRVYQPGSLG